MINDKFLNSLRIIRKNFKNLIKIKINFHGFCKLDRKVLETKI